jgi:hypothetical protein
VATLASLVWMALAELRMLPISRVGVARQERRRVARLTAEVPGVLEVVYRHAVVEGDRFRMHPGFRSFQPVASGQVIADDARGPVAVPQDGYLLMPLYQKLGDDGFFVARKVWSFWLALSSLLRYLRAGHVAHWLPGVSRVEGRDGALAVDRRLARWFSLEVLHLLGFRKRGEEGETLFVERRSGDLP